ncbi:ATP-binding protein [Chloroflexota bacterium]
MDKQAQTLTESKWLSAVENVSRILITDREIETTLQLALDYLIHKLEAADIGIVWIYEPSTSLLIAQVASGFDFNTLKQFRLNASEEMIGRVFQTGKSERYQAREAMPGTEATSTEKIFGTEIPGLNFPSAVACIPLNTDKVKHGVLTLLNLGRGTRFTQRDILFLQVIANLLTLVMKKAAFRKDLKVKEGLGSYGYYKAELISTLAHEMRTPLTSIKGYSTALLMEEAAFKPKAQREFLEIIDMECDILEELISDFLESSTIDEGTMKIDFQPVRLPHLVVQAADEVRRRFPKHFLLVDFSDEFPLVDADPERILQVVRQLLDNAAKYSPKGGLIVLQGKIVEDKAVISVADEGVGIAPEDINHLFDRFFRAKSNSGTQIIGTGLGLPISRAIVEAHGGRIWAESQLGRGSTFYFSLPLKGPSQDLLD